MIACHLRLNRQTGIELYTEKNCENKDFHKCMFFFLQSSFSLVLGTKVIQMHRILEFEEAQEIIKNKNKTAYLLMRKLPKPKPKPKPK